MSILLGFTINQMGQIGFPVQGKVRSALGRLACLWVFSPSHSLGHEPSWLTLYEPPVDQASCVLSFPSSPSSFLGIRYSDLLQLSLVSLLPGSCIQYLFGTHLGASLGSKLLNSNYSNTPGIEPQVKRT